MQEGSQTITATDSMAGISGTSGSINVTPVYAATATDNSPVLNIQLGTGAQVGIVSLSNYTYELTLASGDWSAPTSDSLVSGDGTPVLTISGTGINLFVGGINIGDTSSSGGDAVAFNDSVDTFYYDPFNIAAYPRRLHQRLELRRKYEFRKRHRTERHRRRRINVGAGANLEGTTGSISLTTSGTISIASGAAVSTGGAITLDQASLEIAPTAVVGTMIQPPSYTNSPVARLISPNVALGNANVLAYDPVGDYGLYEASYNGDSVSEFAPGNLAHHDSHRR